MNLQIVGIAGIVTAVILSNQECEIGFVKIDNFCEEACALTPCQELI